MGNDSFSSLPLMSAPHTSLSEGVGWGWSLALSFCELGKGSRARFSDHSSPGRCVKIQVPGSSPRTIESVIFLDTDAEPGLLLHTGDTVMDKIQLLSHIFSSSSSS